MNVFTPKYKCRKKGTGYFFKEKGLPVDLLISIIEDLVDNELKSSLSPFSIRNRIMCVS
jgi:hypothetical protein